MSIKFYVENFVGKIIYFVAQRVNSPVHDDDENRKQKQKTIAYVCSKTGDTKQVRTGYFVAGIRKER